MGIDIVQWRMRIGLNSQPVRSISHLDTLKIGKPSLFIRVLLFLLLAAQCVEINPGPLHGTGANRGGGNDRGRGRGTSSYDNEGNQRRLRSNAGVSPSPMQGQLNMSAGQPQINAWLNSPSQANVMHNNSGVRGETGIEELKSIMLNVQATVSNMESRFNQFESSLTQVKESNKRLEDNQREMNTTVNNLTSKVTKLESELKQSQRKCEQLEAQSRRENLRLYGLEERPNETWEETEQNVRDYIRKDLEIDESGVQIERAHRLSSKEKPRPVIVKFSFYKDRDKILKTYKQKKKQIREAENADIARNESGNEAGLIVDPEFRRDIHMCEDFPARVMKARNDLRPKTEGQNAYIRYDTLMIENSAYIYDEETEDIIAVDK